MGEQTASDIENPVKSTGSKIEVTASQGPSGAMPSNDTSNGRSKGSKRKESLNEYITKSVIKGGYHLRDATKVRVRNYDLELAEFCDDERDEEYSPSQDGGTKDEDLESETKRRDLKPVNAVNKKGTGTVKMASMKKVSRIKK